jgi:hypothetical protein
MQHQRPGVRSTSDPKSDARNGAPHKAPEERSIPTAAELSSVAPTDPVVEVRRLDTDGGVLTVTGMDNGVVGSSSSRCLIESMIVSKSL